MNRAHVVSGVLYFHLAYYMHTYKLINEIKIIIFNGGAPSASNRVNNQKNQYYRT